MDLIVPRVFWDGHDEDRVEVIVCCGVAVGGDSGVPVQVDSVGQEQPEGKRR